ncbi:MAG: hypothetical protein JXQ30_12155 [Spirochaetes bacterium]|nr:hypothetical protein [Spirochaetota bacterium]
MGKMISVEEWRRIMNGYGASIWPAQIVFFAAAIVLVALAMLKPGRIWDVLIKLYFTVSFAWNGIMFYLIHARGLTGSVYGNALYCAIFMLVSVLFAVDIFRRRMSFSLPRARWRKFATVVLLFLIFCYPLIGKLLGHPATRLLFPGAIGCPTTALALVLLTTSLPRVDRTVYIILLVFAIPATPFLQIARYGVYEDGIMLVSGIYALVMLILYRKNRPARAVT